MQTKRLNLREVVIIAICIICVNTAFGQTSKEKVAVYITGEVDASYKKVIGAKMVSAITKDEHYAAVERTADFLAELSKEQIYQRTGAVDDRQIVELGKQFGVSFVCVADVSKVFDSYFISARMINVKTGLITATAERDKEIKGMADLNELAEGVSDGLINNTADCNKKDQPVDKKGCCMGLVVIDGICRDLKGDLSWTGFSLSSERQYNVKYKKIQIPSGYRLPYLEEAKALYKIFKQPLWINEYERTEAYSNSFSRTNVYFSDYATEYNTYYVWNGNALEIGYQNEYEKVFGYHYYGKYDDTKKTIFPEISKSALAIFIKSEIRTGR